MSTFPLVQNIAHNWVTTHRVPDVAVCIFSGILLSIFGAERARGVDSSSKVSSLPLISSNERAHNDEALWALTESNDPMAFAKTQDCSKLPAAILHPVVTPCQRLACVSSNHQNLGLSTPDGMDAHSGHGRVTPCTNGIRSAQMEAHGMNNQDCSGKGGAGPYDNFPVSLPFFQSTPDGKLSSELYPEISDDIRNSLMAEALALYQGLRAVWLFVVIGHQAHFALSMICEFALRRALDAARKGDFATARTNLRLAARAWSGQGATYALSADYRSEIYSQFLREQMPACFSGRWIREYQLHKSAYAEFSRMVREFPPDIRAEFKSVIAAYTAAEKPHDEVAEKLVPGGASLLQNQLEREGLRLSDYVVTDDEYRRYDRWMLIDRQPRTFAEMVSAIRTALHAANRVICEMVRAGTVNIALQYEFQYAMAASFQILAAPMPAPELTKPATPDDDSACATSTPGPVPPSHDPVASKGYAFHDQHQN